MCSTIFLMNLVSEFIPQGAIILKINKNSKLVKLRSEEDIMIAVEYMYSNKFYTMIISNCNNKWEIIDTFDVLDNSQQYFNNSKIYRKKDNNSSVEMLCRNIEGENRIDKVEMKDTNDVIITSAIGNINGDNIDDKVYIVGTYENKDNLILSNLKLIVKYGGTNKEESIKLPVNLVYSPRIRLLSFRTKKYKDIFLSMFTLDADENTEYFIYSYENGKLRNTFNPKEFNKTNKFKVSFVENYVLKILSEKTNLIYKIDLSQDDKELIKKMYYKNGKLEKEFPPDILTVSELEHVDPRDVLKNDLYELLVYNRIIGLNSINTLGVIEAYMHWDHNNFVPRFQYMVNFGKTLEGTL